MARLTWTVGKRWGTKPTKQTAATEIDSGCNTSNDKLRPVTCDEDSQPKQSNGKTQTVFVKECINNGRDRLRSQIIDLLSYHHDSPKIINANHCSQQIHQTYKVLPQIQGEGTAGQVRYCIHRPTSKLCAVKTISKAQTKRKDRIEREISFLKQVKHPNIIQVYDVYEDDKEVHIVTELCQGGELFYKIVEKAKAAHKRDNAKKNKRSIRRNSKKQVAAVQLEASANSSSPHLPACFCEKDAARIIHSLLEAVQYLHSKDIVHRDIKPENIMFKEKDEGSPIKLVDFGLAIKHTRECKQLTNSVGTAYYMSPEVLNNSYDRSCDMWSVGVVAYVLLCGQPPFSGSTNEAIFENIKKANYTMEGTPFWDKGVSKVAKNFIRGLLDLDPKRRWTADMALEHEWLKAAKV